MGGFSSHKQAIVAAILLACLVNSATADERNLIRNGSFEQNGGNGNAVTGWTKIVNCYGAWNGGGASAKAKSGAWMLHPGAGYRTGGAFQDVRTWQGQQYRLTFWAVGFPDNNGQSVTAAVQRGKVQVGTPGEDDRDLDIENRAELVDGVFEVPRFRKTQDWRQFSHQFTATSDTTRITFENIGQGPGRNAINVDDVRVEPIGQLVPQHVEAPRRQEEERRRHEQRWSSARTRCPQLVFVKRHHFRPPGAGGVLLCWYDNLASKNLVQFYYLTPPQELTGHFIPRASGSCVSRIVELIDENHGDVTVDDKSRRKLYSWIEANIPYYGTYEHTRPGTAGSRDARTGKWIDQLTESFNRRCAKCHGNLDRQQNRHSTWVNLTHPEFSRMLNAPLAKSAGGLERCREKDGHQPVRFADKSDPDYRAMLGWIIEGNQLLESNPRMDMPGAVSVPYEQDFGHLYRGRGK